MAIKSGFYNSVNGDRVYNADDLNNFFEGIMTDGVLKSYKNELQVTATTGMTVRVLTGKAVCLDKYIHNTSALDLTIEGGDTLPRIDAVVVGTNLEGRTGNIYVKKGTPASTPSAPSLFNNPNTKEMALAYINVSANATTITASDITDKRNDTNVCGWIKLLNVAPELITYRNNVTTTGTSTSIIYVGIPQFVAARDTLLVYENGLLMEETTEYLIEGTGSAAKLHLATAAPAGNRFTFILMHIA